MTTAAPATIESKPQMYAPAKADDPNKKIEEMKTMVKFIIAYLILLLIEHEQHI